MVIRQPWTKVSEAWAAHIKRAKRLRSQFPVGSTATVSWKWDASAAFSTRPDAVDDSFSGNIIEYDERGQMHLRNERYVLFVIPCAHITAIK